nr:Retrovirus-related Pol polyprotein from transposon TNT 1-94 [Ipomoea batatas]
MVDNRSVMEQFHEIVKILGQIRQHGMNMDDSIAIASIIDKLPPSWKKVHHALMQRKEELTMEKLRSHLNVEEGIRQKESKNKGSARKNRKAQMEGKSSGDHGQTDSWWVDIGATRHVCKDINLYKIYKSLENGPSLYMGNDSMVKVKGIRQVELLLTSRKKLTLTDVYHAPDVRKNFVFGIVLNKCGFKLVFEVDRFILSKAGTFVGQ